MRFDVLTLFPELFGDFVEQSLIRRARDRGILEIRAVNIRDFCTDRHKKADDTPFGGGSGMLLKPEPIFAAHESLTGPAQTPPWTVYLTPAGARLDQEKVRELSRHGHLILLCGRYEGVDQRVIDHLVDEEISIGDYVLQGGELPAMVLIEAVSRQIPGVLGNEGSLEHESFQEGLLEYPQYTKPRVFRGLEVPEVLFGGNHAKIEEWKRQKALERTRRQRPDLVPSETEAATRSGTIGDGGSDRGNGTGHTERIDK